MTSKEHAVSRVPWSETSSRSKPEGTTDSGYQGLRLNHRQHYPLTDLVYKTGSLFTTRFYSPITPLHLTRQHPGKLKQSL